MKMGNSNNGDLSFIGAIRPPHHRALSMSQIVLPLPLIPHPGIHFSPSCSTLIGAARRHPHSAVASLAIALPDTIECQSECGLRPAALAVPQRSQHLSLRRGECAMCKSVNAPWLQERRHQAQGQGSRGEGPAGGRKEAVDTQQLHV